MELREWQQQFQQVVLTGADNPSLRLREGAVERHHQLGVYSHAYGSRLSEALRTNFSMLHRLLGDDDFDAMAEMYLQVWPSTTASIRWFGDRLAGFLAEYALFATVPALSELAQFEWALRHTIDAADMPRLTASALQPLPMGNWGALRFALHPSLSVLRLRWNAPQIWQALKDSAEPPEPRETEDNWLVYRHPDLATRWRSADDCELSALRIWDEGGTFDDVCDSLERRVSGGMSGDHTAMVAATLLRTWVEQGLLVHRSRH